MESLNLNSQEREMRPLQQMQDKGTSIEGGFKRAFATLFERSSIPDSRSIMMKERAKHKQEYDRRMNDRMMQSKERNANLSKALDAGLVVTESNETESERHPMAEVQLIAEHNILANEQQHYKQSESIYDTYLLEKVDRNTTSDSTDMSHRGGEIDHNAVKCQVSCPLLDPSFDNMTTEFSNQSL
ncbi:hypothetical protein Tco_1222374 [Tanacetum coccineum]